MQKQDIERLYFFHPPEDHDDEPRRWQAQVNAREKDELARCLYAAKSLVKEQAKQADVKADLRIAWSTLFQLTRASSNAAKIDAYVDARCRELNGEPAKVWFKELEQTQHAIDAARLKLQELRAELRARLERQAWSGISQDNRAAVQQHFRRQCDHGQLYRQLKAQTFAEVEAGMKCALDIMSTADLLQQVNDLSTHKHVKAGEQCPECSSQLVDRARSFDGGKFVGCSQFPECTYAWGVELGHTRKHQPPESEKVNAAVTTAAHKDALTALSQELALLFGTPTVARICTRAGLQQTLTTPWDSSTGMATLWSTLLIAAEKEGKHEQLWLAIADAVDDAYRRSIATSKLQLLSPLWQACKFTSMHSNAGTTTVPEATVTKEEVKTTMAESTKTKAAPSIGGMASMLFEMTKDDMGDAVWRTAADETVETLKAPAKIALRKAQRTAVGKPIAAFALKAIDHPLGEGIFAQCCGMGLVAYGPLRGNTLGPKTARLSKELRVKGWQPFTDLFAKTIIAPVRDTIVKLIESLPDQSS